MEILCRRGASFHDELSCEFQSNAFHSFVIALWRVTAPGPVGDTFLKPERLQCTGWSLERAHGVP